MKAEQLTISLQNALTTPHSLPESQCFRLWAAAALQSMPEPAELTIRIVEPGEIQELNRDYRAKDQPTNVLSFPFEYPDELPPEAREENYLGDLVICAEIVGSEAQNQHKPELNHWAHIVIHGILHLCGYDHISDEDAAVMEPLETEILAGLGIPDPYQD